MLNNRFTCWAIIAAVSVAIIGGIIVNLSDAVELSINFIGFA